MTDNSATGSTGKAARLASMFARAGLALGVICAIASIAAGLGARMELWHFRVGFTILQWATYGAFAVIVISLVGVILAQRTNLRAARTAGVLGLVVGLLTAAPPLYEYYLVQSVPRIHDISTDTANPPQFSEVLKLRNKDDNSLEPSAEVAAQQAKAFPDLQPMVVAETPQQAFRRAEVAARAMGWNIDAVDPQAMRIEATATTLLFGFK